MKSWIWFLFGAIVLAVVSSVITGVVTRNNVRNSVNDNSGSSSEDPPTGNAIPAPEGFIWATATAAYQVEGAWNEFGRGWANWDYYLNVMNLANGETGEDGIRFIEHMEDDIALWEELGVTDSRISLAWSRLIPSGYLQVEDLPEAWRSQVIYENDVPYLPSDVWFDRNVPAVSQCISRRGGDEEPCVPGRVKIGMEQQGIDLYRRLIGLMNDVGIKPLITVYHWDHPLPLQTWGSWENHNMVDRFAEYARFVFEHFGNSCERWMVFNEPFVGPSWLELEAIRGRAGVDPNIGNYEGWQFSPAAYFQVRHHITVASARAYQIGKQLKEQGIMDNHIQVGTTIAQAPARSETTDARTLEFVRYSALITHLWDIETSVVGRHPHGLLDYFRNLHGYDPAVEIETWSADLELIANNHAEFIGINYYTPWYIRETDSQTAWKLFENYIPEHLQDNLHVNGITDPDALRDQLVLMHNDYGGIPTYITENGYGTATDVQDEVVDGAVDDHKRCLYVIGHIKAVLEARQLGANVGAYTLWSSHDNLEWYTGYGRRFGSIYVDYAGGYTRYPKKSFFAFQKIIADNGLFDADICDTIPFQPNQI